MSFNLMIKVSQNLQIRNDINNYEISKLSSGRNAGAYLIKSSGRNMVVKSYQQTSESYERFAREKLFLEHCLEKEISCVPKIIDYDYRAKQILMEHLGNSSEIKMSTNTCLALFEFVKCLNKNSSKKFSNAKDAYLDEMNVSLDIERRIQQVSNLKLTGPLKSYFEEVSHIFLSSSFSNLVNLPFQSDTVSKFVGFISPSDVGLHNMLLIEQKYYFIDFEYSGYDNPLKFLCDFITNPDNDIDDMLVPKVIDLFQAFFAIPVNEWIFDTLKFFSIKWCLILIEHSQKSLLMGQGQDLDQKMVSKLSSLITRTK